MAGDVLSVNECQTIIEKTLNSHAEVLNYSVQPLRVTSSDYSLTFINIDLKSAKLGLKILVKKFRNTSYFEKEVLIYEKFKKKNFASMDCTPLCVFGKNNIIAFKGVDNFDLNANDFDLIHIKLVLKTLANYHSVSLAYQESQFKTTHFFQPQDLTRIVELLPNFNDQIRQLAKTNFSDLRQIFCHGNLQSTNVIFKHHNKIPVECKLINFEMVKFCPPAYDVLFFLYTTTTSEFRQKHLDELLDFYYSNLEVHQNNVTQDEFEMSVKRLLPIVKLQACCVAENKTRLKDALFELEDFLAHERILLEDCFKIIKNKLGTTDYKLLSYSLKPLDEMKGFLGEHNRLKIELMVNNEKKVLNLFAKYMPEKHFQFELVSHSQSFSKEVFAYKTLLPEIKKSGVDIISDCVNPCYFARNNDSLIFDDLGIESFKTLGPRETFTYDYLMLAVKKLAKFHAASIIFEERNPEFYQRFKEQFSEGFFSNEGDHRGIQCIATAEHTIYHLIDLFPENGSKISQEEFKFRSKKAIDLFYKLNKPSTVYRNTICHGDLWASNIMYKIDNGKPIECKFIDFQLIRYNPPAHDLLFLFHMTTDRKHREQYMSEAIRLYYKELTKWLKTFDFDLNSIYTYDEFVRSCEHLKVQAVCFRALYSQLIMVSSQDLMKIGSDETTAIKFYYEDRKDLMTELCDRDPIFRNKLHETILDLRQFCENCID